MMRKKIKKLLKTTKEVFREISYENGAITSLSKFALEFLSCFFSS
jgi:hypothetical protein